jgi:F-box and WD-40 domain protein CDC4
MQVLDFGAYRDGVPEHRLGKRILVDRRGHEANEEIDDSADYEASGI